MSKMKGLQAIALAIIAAMFSMTAYGVNMSNIDPEVYCQKTAHSIAKPILMQHRDGVPLAEVIKGLRLEFEGHPKAMAALEMIAVKIYKTPRPILNGEASDPFIKQFLKNYYRSCLAGYQRRLQIENKLK